jgi:PAS domain-containing protein
LKLAVVIVSPNPDAVSRVKAVLAVSKVLPGLELVDCEAIDKGFVTHLFTPTYAAVASSRALSDASSQLNDLAEKYDRVIIVRGDNDPGIIEHSLLHELGHVSYYQRYPEKVRERQAFYQKVRDAVNSNSKLSYILAKTYSFTEANPKARVLLGLEADELYSNRFAYQYNTDKLAYTTLVNRELQMAVKTWAKMDGAFDAAFHMVVMDLYTRVTNQRWIDSLPYRLRWMLPYTTRIVDAVDSEDHKALFGRQIMLFNAVNGWADITEEELLRILSD